MTGTTRPLYVPEEHRRVSYRGVKEHLLQDQGLLAVERHWRMSSPQDKLRGADDLSQVSVCDSFDPVFRGDRHQLQFISQLASVKTISGRTKKAKRLNKELNLTIFGGYYFYLSSTLYLPIGLRCNARFIFKAARVSPTPISEGHPTKNFHFSGHANHKTQIITWT
jgi:hypothetical protein